MHLDREELAFLCCYHKHYGQFHTLQSYWLMASSWTWSYCLCHFVFLIKFQTAKDSWSNFIKIKRCFNKKEIKLVRRHNSSQFYSVVTEEINRSLELKKKYLFQKQSN